MDGGDASSLGESLAPNAADATAAPASGAAVGECIDDMHPTLQGRVKVRWQAHEQRHECWLPTLQGLSLRAGDRVLLTFAEGCPDPIVTGVVDGFARRPEVEKRDAEALRLRPDEHVSVVGADEQPLLQISQSENGPVVRLCREDLDLEVPGKLRISARELELNAKQGQARIDASDDVVVRGETVRLN